MSHPGLLANYHPQILANHPTHLIRQTQSSGQIKAVIGQDVAPDTILGHYQQPSGFFSINLAQRLNVSTPEALRYLQKKLGQNIYKGELLAEKKSLFSQLVLTSPTDGILESYNAQTGILLIKFFPKTITITAGVYGVIDQIDVKGGQIKIKTFVNQINGVVGSGRQRLGVLEVIDNPANLTKTNQLTPQMTSRIVVVGALIERDALIKAVSLGIGGLITGGINYHNFQPMVNKFDTNVHITTDVGLTLIVLEAFGANPIEANLFQLLKSNQGQFAYINGDPPQLLLPSATEADLASLRKIVLPPNHMDSEFDVKSLEVGQKVKIIASPYMGACGKIIAIDQTPTTLESGIATFLLTIDVVSRKIKVPYPNVEII